MEIKILGTGCKKCDTLTKSTKKAVAELGIEANIIKVDDIMEIMKYSVMQTPALLINEKIVLKGKSPSVKELKKLLSQ